MAHQERDRIEKSGLRYDVYGPAGVLRNTNWEAVQNPNENAYSIAAQVDNLEKDIDTTVQALTDVMEWINNWSPNFTEDEEWDEVNDRAKAILNKEIQNDTT